MSRLLSCGALLASLILTAEAAIAQQFCEPKTDILYLNGVRSTPEDGSKALKAAIQPHTSQGKPIEFGVLPNVSLDMLDFAESFHQWAEQQASEGRAIPVFLAARILALFRQGKSFCHLPGVGNFCAAIARQLMQLMLEATQRFLDEANQVVVAQRRATTDMLVATVQGKLDSGNRVVIVSHSQGNFFANDIYARLGGNRNSLEVIGAAVPAPSGTVATQPYVTYNDDIIRRVPNSAPPNTPNAPTCGGLDLFCQWEVHGFAESYMKTGSQGRGNLIGYVNTALAALPFPTPIFANGIIAATLRWDEQPDVDLHVFEPGGSHVFYGAMTGASGTLDLDDVTGFGPENYVVCDGDNVQEGSYRIGMNYYSGNGPTTTNLLVKAGNPQQSRPIGPIILSTPRGSSGDDSPQPAATVTVTRDADGKRVYQIKEGW